MNPFFCVEESCDAGEDLIGTAATHQTYVLIECPPPWTEDEFASKSTPVEVKACIERLYGTQRSLRFLAIYNETLRAEFTRVLIFVKPAGLAQRFKRKELHIYDLDELAPRIGAYLQQPDSWEEDSSDAIQDFLICTHGSVDKCCARYGNPLYRAAQRIVTERSLHHVRVWQASHFGGHRFAPTAIAFPDGRYYGRLDPGSFTALMTRSGAIEQVRSIYRGWARLPYPIQAIERELMCRYGWNWFNFAVDYQILEQSEDEQFSRVQMQFVTTSGETEFYQADVIEDASKTLYLRGECSNAEPCKHIQFTVKNLVQLPVQVCL